MSALPELIREPASSPDAPAAGFAFDTRSRASSSDQPVPLGGVPSALRQAAVDAGVDPIAELYNEALRYAAEGHLRLARERLGMLLCMSPDDGDARLLLARVHVAGQKWSDALMALDEAASHGVQVPMPLRRAVEDHLRAEAAAEDEQKSAVRHREQGEIKALRQEARRLRDEGAALLQRTSHLEREVSRWAWATAAAAMVTVLFVVFNLAFGSGAAPVEAPVAVAAVPAVETEGAAGAPVGEAAEADQPPTANEVATAAGQAIADAPGLEGTSLQVTVKGSTATAKGEVTAFRQRAVAEKTLKAVPGIQKVDVSQVVILARTRGTTHSVVSGDSLSKIAHQYYGDSTISEKIRKANGDVLKGGDSLSVGMKLKIPPAP